MWPTGPVYKSPRLPIYKGLMDRPVNKRRKFTDSERRIILRHYSGKCQICGKKVDPDIFDLGHIKAHIKGGKKVVPMHPKCNRTQGTRTAGEFRKRLGISKPKTRKGKPTKRKIKRRVREWNPVLG